PPPARSRCAHCAGRRSRSCATSEIPLWDDREQRFLRGEEWMEPAKPARVLVVTDRTAATPALLQAVHERAVRSPAEFRVLVPNPAPAEWHPFHPERRDKV